MAAVIIMLTLRWQYVWCLRVCLRLFVVRQHKWLLVISDDASALSPTSQQSLSTLVLSYFFCMSCLLILLYTTCVPLFLLSVSLHNFQQKEFYHFHHIYVVCHYHPEMFSVISLITCYLIKQMEHCVHYIVICSPTDTHICLALFQIVLNLSVHGFVLLVMTSWDLRSTHS